MFRENHSFDPFRPNESPPPPPPNKFEPVGRQNFGNLSGKPPLHYLTQCLNACIFALKKTLLLQKLLSIVSMG